MAWLAATIINGTGWRKTPVKIEDLLGKKPDTEKPSGSQMQRDYDELKARRALKRSAVSTQQSGLK